MVKKQQSKIFAKWILLACILFGIVSGVYLVQNRIKIEQEQNHIENIVNYEAVLRESKFEKNNKQEIFNELKNSGVTALAIYDMTLKKLVDNGQVIVKDGGDTPYITFTDINKKSTPGETYIFPVQGKETYFIETKEALEQRLGKNHIQIVDTNNGNAIQVDIAYSQLKEFNLALSVEQAKTVNELGFNTIIRPTNFANSTHSEIKFELDRIAKMKNVTGIVFVGKEVLGYKDNIKYTVKRLNEMHIPIVGIESTTQLQYEMQQGFLEMAKMDNYQVGRLYTIPDDYLKKLQPEKVSQMFYISDIERNVRYNLFNLYKKGKNNETALQTSIGYMKVIKEKLENRGFVLGKASIYPEYQPNKVAIAGTLLGAIALFMFTLQLLVPMKINKQYLLFVILLLITAIVEIIGKGIIIRQLWGLSSAIMAPSASLIVIMDIWKKYKPITSESPLKSIVVGSIYIVLAAMLASVGGIFIGAILGSNDFFMEFQIFRGVKLTFVLPIILVTIAYLERFPIWQGQCINTKNEWKRFVRDILAKDVKVVTLLAIGVLLIVAWVFVGRSGHSAGVPVPGFELKLRQFLENVMYARPREKEFMIGYPALLAATYIFRQRWPFSYHFIFTIASVICLGSMVETFAHIRTPILMSIMRGFDGVWLGIIVGLVCLVALIIAKHLLDWLMKGDETII